MIRYVHMSWLPWARAEETIPLSFLQYLHTPSGAAPGAQERAPGCPERGLSHPCPLSFPRARRGRRRVCWGRTGVFRPLLLASFWGRRVPRAACCGMQHGHAERLGPPPPPRFGLPSQRCGLNSFAGGRAGAWGGRRARAAASQHVTLRSAHGRGAGAACRSGREGWAPAGHAGARLLGRCAVLCLPRAPVLPLCIPATERTIARRHPRRRGLGPFCRAVCCSACIWKCDVALIKSSGVADADDSGQNVARLSQAMGEGAFPGWRAGRFFFLAVDICALGRRDGTDEGDKEAAVAHTVAGMLGGYRAGAHAFVGGQRHVLVRG